MHFEMCSLPHFKNFQVNFEVFAQHDKLSNTIDLHLPNNFDKAARSAPKARLYVYFSCFNSGKFSTNKVNCEQLTHALEIQCELQTIYIPNFLIIDSINSLKVIEAVVTLSLCQCG